MGLGAIAVRHGIMEERDRICEGLKRLYTSMQLLKRLYIFEPWYSKNYITLHAYILIIICVGCTPTQRSEISYTLRVCACNIKNNTTKKLNTKSKGGATVNVHSTTCIMYIDCVHN